MIYIWMLFISVVIATLLVDNIVEFLTLVIMLTCIAFLIAMQ